MKNFKNKNVSKLDSLYIMTMVTIAAIIFNLLILYLIISTSSFHYINTLYINYGSFCQKLYIYIYFTIIFSELLCNFLICYIFVIKYIYDNII